MGLKAVFFDLDDTLYTSFQAGDAYAYEKLEEWAISTFGDKGKGFADAFRVNRKRLARQQPAMPPTHDRVLFAQGALERMGLNAVRYSREAFRVYWNAVFAKMTLRPGVAEFLDELRAAGYALGEIGEKLAENYIKQILDDGFFHADPHQGNMVIRGGKIVWLDLGMVGVLSSRDRQIFRTAMLAITRQDIYELENAIMSLGVLKTKINHNELYEDIRIFVDRYGSSDLQDLHLGKVLGEMMDIASKHQIGMPNSVTMLIRGVLTIEGVLEDCSPETSLMGILANHFSAGVLSMDSAEQELRHLLRKFAGSAEKVSDIPLNLADIIKMTVRGQTKINLELTGSEEPIAKADRMVDRLVFGIIDGALLIGSSMLCTTNMHPQILGIPAIGAAGFFIAFLLSGVLLLDIVRKHK